MTDPMARCSYCEGWGFYAWQYIDGQEVRVHHPDCPNGPADTELKDKR